MIAALYVAYVGAHLLASAFFLVLGFVSARAFIARANVVRHRELRPRAARLLTFAGLALLSAYSGIAGALFRMAVAP